MELMFSNSPDFMWQRWSLHSFRRQVSCLRHLFPNRPEDILSASPSQVVVAGHWSWNTSV